jgi:hypothetical protein
LRDSKKERRRQVDDVSSTPSYRKRFRGLSSALSSSPLSRRRKGSPVSATSASGSQVGSITWRDRQASSGSVFDVVEHGSKRLRRFRRARLEVGKGSVLFLPLFDEVEVGFKLFDEVGLLDDHELKRPRNWQSELIAPSEVPLKVDQRRRPRGSFDDPVALGGTSETALTLLVC